MLKFDYFNSLLEYLGVHCRTVFGKGKTTLLIAILLPKVKTYLSHSKSAPSREMNIKAVKMGATIETIINMKYHFGVLDCSIISANRASNNKNKKIMGSMIVNSEAV